MGTITRIPATNVKVVVTFGTNESYFVQALIHMQLLLPKKGRIDGLARVPKRRRRRQEQDTIAATAKRHSLRITGGN